MVEVTHQERVINAPVLKDIIHGFPEDFKGVVLTYPLNEIFAEKLHAILQNTKKLHERGWTRSRARDYYDIWRMLQVFRHELNPTIILNTLSLKSEGKGVSYQNITDFFDVKALETVQRDWVQWLSPMIYPLSPYEKVISDLKGELSEFLK